MSVESALWKQNIVIYDNGTTRTLIAPTQTRPNWDPAKSKVLLDQVWSTNVNP